MEKLKDWIWMKTSVALPELVLKTFVSAGIKV